MRTDSTPSLGSRHLERLEGLRPHMAKVLNKDETPWREQIGRAIQRAFSLAGVSQKEAAALIGRDQAQIARWVSATERPQFDAIFSVEQLRHPLIQALSEYAGAEVEVTVRLRRAV